MIKKEILSILKYNCLISDNYIYKLYDKREYITDHNDLENQIRKLTSYIYTSFWYSKYLYLK